MSRGKFGEHLIGIESDFTRDGANDRAAIDSFRQSRHAIALEPLDRADG
jgi:hypothetical protein